ncbi:MAG: PAS domain-containing protein [Methermicoccaceae archaeon]
MANILVVDDEESIRKTLKRILEKEGHFVATAESYNDAGERFLENEFDVIVADIVLPDVSGTELLKFFKEAGYDNPIVLITGKPSIESVQEAVRYKAFDYVTKPIEYRNFIEVINKALQEVERTQKDISNRISEYMKIREVTEEVERMRKEMDALRKEISSKEAYIKRLYDTHSFALLVADESGKITDANRMCERLIGKSKDEMIGKNLFDFLSLGDDIYEKVTKERTITVPKDGYEVELYYTEEGGTNFMMAVLIPS